MEDNFWNPSVGTPQQAVNEYDQSLDSSFKEPDIQSGLSAPSEPVSTSQPQQQQQDDGMWNPQGMDMQQQQMQLPDLPEVGKPGIDYDMGHIEKIGKSLLVGLGDLFTSVGDMADFIGGSPSSQVQKEIYGVETEKPLSDAFHDFGKYLQSYGDDVPGLNDLQDVSWDDLTDINFWETGVARMLPFALSLLVPAGGVARGVSVLSKGAKFTNLAKGIAAGGRSIGLSKSVANTLNATKLIRTGLATTAAGATSNLIEGAALAGQTLNEGVAQGLDPKVAQNAARQVYVDNLASMAADIAQWALFTGQMRVGSAIANTAKNAAKGVAGASTKAGIKAAQATLKNTGIGPAVKNGFKAIGMGAANGVTDGVIEQFQEVYQDYSVQRRIAEAKGDEFMSYMDFFMADEQRPTRVLSFATSLLMSGVSNTINTAAENRYTLNQSLNEKAESHELLDIFNKDLDSGTYSFKDKDGNLVELSAEQATMLGRDTAARTMIQNAVVHGDSQAVMEFLESQVEGGQITQDQFEMYQETLTQVEAAVQNYPTQNLSTSEKAELVANAWLNNVTSANLEKQRGEFQQRMDEVQSLVDDGKQTQAWADKEIAGLKEAEKQALKQEELIKQASSDQIAEVYKKADARIEQERFAKEEGKQLVEIAEKEVAGQELSQEEQDLIDNNKEFYGQAKQVIQQADRTNKAAEFVGRKEFAKYGPAKTQKDGSVEFVKENKDGSYDAIVVSPTGEVSLETNKDDASLQSAEETNKTKIQSEYDAFVETGKVEKDTIERIAYKIINNRGLTKEEEAMRQGAAEEVEKLIKAEAEEQAPVIDKTKVTAKAQELAEEYKIDLSKVKGTGKNGRITKADIQKYIRETPLESVEGSEQIKLKLLKRLEGAKDAVVLAKNAAIDFTKKSFTKENVGKIIDVMERAYMKRKIKNALPLGDGSENAVIDMLSEKAADGLVSVNGIVALAKQGPKFAGYAAGMSVFINNDGDAKQEAFFHENFHIFRILYANYPEVQEMMKHIVNQPIYNKTKLDYQENIIYAAPSRKGEKAYIRQEDALRLIKKRTGKIMATTIEEYIQLNSIQQVTAETYKEFYEESLQILKDNNYVELSAQEQTNIQDEALTKLAGIYGAYNQDLFIADEGKRKSYNNSMRSWKEKISKAFTKEESDWTLEQASNNQYKKTDEFDFEAAFDGIKDLIAKEEAQYGNLAKESPSTVKIKQLKNEKLQSQIEQEITNAEGTIVKDAKEFYKSIEKDLLTAEQLAEATDEEIVANKKAMLRSSREFRRAKEKFKANLLLNYTEGTQEYRDVRNALRDNNKQIDAYIRQMFTNAAVSKEGLQLNLFTEEEMSEMDDNALVALINGEHQDIAAKFYMHVRQFIENEKYIGKFSKDNDLMSGVTKANIMFLLKRVQMSYPSPMAYTQKAQEFIDDTQGKTKKDIRKEQNKKRDKEISETALNNLIILGNFFNYLQTEVDSSGNNIFKNVMLQFRSMTTDRGLMWDGERFSPSLSMQLRRKIASAKVESSQDFTEEVALNKFGQPEAMAFLEKIQQQIYEGGIASVKEDQFKTWSNLKQRLNYSRRLVQLLYGQDTIQDVEKREFINKFLLSKDNQLSKDQFQNLSIRDENGDYRPIKNYFSRDQLEKMLWASVSISISEKEKQNISLQEFQDRARKDVFNPIFNSYIVNKNRQDSINLGVETNTLTKNKVDELQEEYNTRLKDLYYQEKFDYNKFKENTIKREHVEFGSDDVIKSEEAKYERYFEKGADDELSENKKRFFIRNKNNDVQELEITKLRIGYQVKEVKVYNYKQRASMQMFVSNEYTKTSLVDMQGVIGPIKSLLSAKIPAEDKSYLYTIMSPKGNMLNKNIRKYFLKYGKDSLLDYIKTKDKGFLSMFTYGITNPYAEKLISGEYELDYHSLDGDLVNTLDRDEITNKEVSEMDIKEIVNAISFGTNMYMQPVRDFSDKTRRYYAEAFTIKSEKEAISKLKDLVNYHMEKTQSIIDRHNDESDEFDMHLVTSSSIINDLRSQGYEIKKTKNEGHTKKGQLNLLGKKAFELKVDGVSYDLSNYEDLKQSTENLMQSLGVDVNYDLSGVIGANYFINKYYLQDMSSSIMEDQDYTMKNKRSTGYIANHDASYAGERVELLVFEDAELSQTELKEKVKVLQYETGEDGKTKAVIKEVNLSDNPAIMDSASVMTQEAADKLIALHGDIVDVKGSFKLVGYGTNIDNKTISGMFGQQRNSFYAKGHTIVVNETSEGPFKAIYKSLKAREKFYKDNKLQGINVLGYADSGMKKGTIKGVEGSPQNKLTLQEWGALVKKGDDAINSFINNYSFDEANDLYGYDGRFFGVQGELDKNAETATSSKQMISGINVFKSHPDSSVRAKAKKVMGRTRIALDVQYQEEVKDLSRDAILRKNAESDSVPTPVATLLEDGKTSMPYMRQQLINLLGRKVINGTHKLRTGGTLSLQESDILYGYAEKAEQIVQTEDRLLPMQVVEEDGKFKVNPAEAIISQHLAETLGVTQEELDGGKEIKFLATRIPSSSAGSTVVLKVKGIATKPGNTIAVSPLVSAIIGSDLDGDMLHINTINTGENLSKLDEARNSLVESIMDLYLTPEVQSSLTKEIEFGSLMDAHNVELFGSKDGDKDVPNDLSMLGTHKMYGQTKGNAPMIGIIASQNLLYNYISEGNPNLFYSASPITVNLDGKTYNNLDNTITKDGGGTWYTVTKWLNLILDDGKNNVRSKYLFFRNTGSTFVMLLKMGVPSEKISSYIKRAGWDTDEFVYWKQPENSGKLEEKLTRMLYEKGAEGDTLQELITDRYITSDGRINIDLNSTSEMDHIAMYLIFDAINEDAFNIGHYLSLDKQFQADPLLALEKHQAALTALQNQTQPEGSNFKGIGNNLGEDNQLFRRNRKVNYELITKFFEEDPYYSLGYKEGLIGKHEESKLLDSNGILNTEISIDKGTKDASALKISTSIFKNQERNMLSQNEESNIKMAKAMHLLRLTVHSDIDIIENIEGIYENPIYGLSNIYSEEAWKSLSSAEKWGLTTEAVAKHILKEGLTDNQFIDKIDAVIENEYILKNGTPSRIRIVRFKPNMSKIINEIDFTDQVRMIQKDFGRLSPELQNFFVAYDFVTTGWGTNGNSISALFSDSKTKQINKIAEKVQDENVSNFKDDLRSFIKKNKLYNSSKQSTPELAVTVNARRIASLVYLSLYGNDNSFANFKEGGLFNVKKENVGLTDANTVTTITDSQWRADRIKNIDKELTTVPLEFYSGVPEASMINILGLATKKQTKNSSNSDIHLGTDEKMLKVPLYEFDGTSYEGIGETMDFDKYVTRKLPTGISYESLSEEDKNQLEKDYIVYEASVKKVKSLYQKIVNEQIEDGVYDKGMTKEEADNKFKRYRDLFREYNDILSYEKIGIAKLSQANLFNDDAKVVTANIDEIAANPLRRYMEYHFGNHIANKQIADWQRIHGKDLGDISETMKAKDISALNMWLSPGDFGKSKPAIAYINKNMKMTHMKYTRNLNLVTKEMNEKLENLYKANYETGFQAQAAKLWLKYMPMGTASINKKLFGNLLQVTTGLKKIIAEDGSVTYRDMSDIRIKPELVYQNGDIKKGEKSPWHKLNEAEQEYLEMYVKFTSFYRELIQNKELYAYNRGGTYVPSVTSSRWETLHKRGLFGVYYQMFRGDQELADIEVEAINPLTGLKDRLDYFSWKSIYMYGDGENFIKIERGKKGEKNLKPKEQVKSGAKRIQELEKIKRTAQSYLDKGIDYKGDKINRTASINDMMALESEEAMNRFNHQRSMTSSYLATGNMHAALRNYVSLFMFQHGTAFRDGDTFTHLQYDEDDREFKAVDVKEEDISTSAHRLAFTGFEDKKQEIDAAIANLGGGKIFEPFAKYGAEKNKNAIQYLQKVVKRGLINKERGFTFSDFESEAQVTNFFVNWTMYIALGLNVPAAFGNVLIGKFNSYRQMGGANQLKGEHRFWGLSKTKGYDHDKLVKSRKMIEEFGILTYRAEEIAEGTGGSSLSSLIFMPMIFAENWIQQAAFLGALTDEQWNSYYVDKNGDLKQREGSVGISQQELAKLERDVINVQGRGYSETDVRLIQMYALSNMTMQFKRWFPTFLKDRFGKEDIDDLGTMRMGAYTAAADFMSKLRDEGKMWNISEWNAELKKLPKHKQDAVMRYWRGTHGVMIVAMLLGMSSMLADDDEKDSAAVELMEKLLGDMLLIVNAPKLTYMANIPAMNTFKNLNLTIYHAAKGTEYQRRSKYGDKGDKKFVSNFAQLLPSPARKVLQFEKSGSRSLR